jgi:hypothetical protein
MAGPEATAINSPLSSHPESLQGDHQDEHVEDDHKTRDSPPSTPVASQVNSATVCTGVEDSSATVKSETTPRNNGKKRKAPVETIRRIVLKKPKHDAKKWQDPFVFSDPKSPFIKSDLRVSQNSTSR